MKINVLLTNGATSVTLNLERDGETSVFSTFDGPPAATVKRLTTAAELSGKKVRRANFRIDVPYVRHVDETTGHKDIRTLSTAVTINIPEESGLQVVDSTVPANEGLNDALALALSSLFTVLSGHSVRVLASELQAVTHPICRASNGLTPMLDAAEFGMASLG